MPVFKSCPVSLTNMSGCDTRNRGIIVWKRVPLASCPDHHNSLKKYQVITEKYKNRVHLYLIFVWTTILYYRIQILLLTDPHPKNLKRRFFFKFYLLVDDHMFRSLYYRVSQKKFHLARHYLWFWQDTIYGILEGLEVLACLFKKQNVLNPW